MFKNYQQAYVTKKLKYSGIMKDEFSFYKMEISSHCLLYTSDAADE